jgi:hypothetical protein
MIALVNTAMNLEVFKRDGLFIDCLRVYKLLTKDYAS